MPYKPYDPLPPTENAIRKGLRLYTQPVAKTLGVEGAIEDLATAKAADSPTMARVKGFAAGAGGAVSPAHLVEAATLLASLPGEGVQLMAKAPGLINKISPVLGRILTAKTVASPALLTKAPRLMNALGTVANATMTTGGAAQTYEDITDPNASGGKVVSDLLNTTLGAVGTGTSGRAYSAASKAVKKLAPAKTTTQQLKDAAEKFIRENNFTGLHETEVADLLKAKDPTLAAAIERNPGSMEYSVPIFGDKAKKAFTPLSAMDSATLAQKTAARDTQALADLEKGKADIKATELKKLDAQLQEAQRPGVAASKAEAKIAKDQGTAIEQNKKVDVTKAKETQKSTTANDKTIEKYIDDTITQAVGERKADIADIDLKAKDLAASQAPLAKGEAALGKLQDQASAENENFDVVRDAREGLDQQPPVVRQTTKAPQGESSTTTWTDPPPEGGEGGREGAPRAPKPIFRAFGAGDGGEAAARIYADVARARGADVDIKKVATNKWLVHTRGFGDRAAQPFTEVEIANALGITPEGEVPTPDATPIPVEPPVLSPKEARAKSLLDLEDKIQKERGVLPVKDVPEVKVQPNPPTGAASIISYPEGMSPLTRAGEEYGIASRAKTSGLVTEEARAAAGQKAASLNTPENRAALTPEDLEAYTDPNAKAKVVKAIAKDKSQLGAIDPLLMFRLGGGIAGGTVGSQSEEHPYLGAAIGAGLGAAAPSLVSPEAGRLADSVPSAVKTGLKNLNRFRNSMLLSPLSVMKKGAGDVQALATAAATHPSRAGDILKQFVTREGLSNLGRNFREGMSTPEMTDASGLENFVTNAKNPMSWAGRAMGGLTKATKGVLGESGFTPDEYNQLTMTAEPTSVLGKKLYEATRESPLLQNLFPFMRMGVNRIERGIDYSPLAAFKESNWARGNRADAAAKVAAGTLAGAAASALTPEGFVKDHPFLTSLAAAGPMGLPILVGMASSSRPSDKPGYEGFAEEGGRAVQAATRDIPGMEFAKSLTENPLYSLPRNYLGGYTNALRTPAELLDPSEFPVDDKSEYLDTKGKLLNRMLGNVPIVRSTLPHTDDLEGQSLEDAVSQAPNALQANLAKYLASVGIGGTQ